MLVEELVEARDLGLRDQPDGEGPEARLYSVAHPVAWSTREGSRASTDASAHVRELSSYYDSAPPADPTAERRLCVVPQPAEAGVLLAPEPAPSAMSPALVGNAQGRHNVRWHMDDGTLVSLLSVVGSASVALASLVGASFDPGTDLLAFVQRQRSSWHAGTSTAQVRVMDSGHLARHLALTGGPDVTHSPPAQRPGVTVTT